MPSPNIVGSGTRPLTKDQRTFNTLIGKIGTARTRLAEWEQAVDRFRQRYVSELLPLQRDNIDLQIDLLLGLDAAFRRFRLTKTERRKISALIVDLALSTLEVRDDDRVKALYNQHSGDDFDDREEAEEEAARALFESIFDVDLGDDVDLKSPEDVAARMERALFEQAEEEAEAAPQRPRSAKQMAREQKEAARREAEEKQLGQSIREVYRKMASALHPDRESDPAERQRKTELMQQVNDAYAKGNLLHLLELQLELEQIDQSHLAGIGPERLRHYVKILKGQLDELELELTAVEDRFIAEFNLPPFIRVNAQHLPSILQEELANRRRILSDQRAQIAIAADLPKLKAWLKSMRLSRRPPREDDFVFF